MINRIQYPEEDNSAPSPTSLVNLNFFKWNDLFFFISTFYNFFKKTNLYLINFILSVIYDTTTIIVIDRKEIIYISTCTLGIESKA